MYLISGLYLKVFAHTTKYTHICYQQKAKRVVRLTQESRQKVFTLGGQTALSKLAYSEAVEEWDVREP